MCHWSFDGSRHILELSQGFILFLCSIITCIPQNPQWGILIFVVQHDLYWLLTFYWIWSKIALELKLSQRLALGKTLIIVLSVYFRAYIYSKYYFQLCTVLDIHGKPMNVGIFSFQSIIQNLVLYYSIYHVHINLP